MSEDNQDEAQEKAALSMDDLEEFEAGKGIDVSEYEGQKVKIEGVEVKRVVTSYDENGDWVEGLKRKKQVLRVFSTTITTVTDGEGNEIKIRASELFNLKHQDGKWGVSTSDKAKINKFLKKLNLPAGKEGVKQIGGQELIVKTSGKNNNFLGFVY